MAAKKKTKAVKPTFEICSGISVDAARLSRVVEKNCAVINKLIKKQKNLSDDDLCHESLFSKKETTTKTGTKKQVNDKCIYKSLAAVEKADADLAASCRGALNQILAGKA